MYIIALVAIGVVVGLAVWNWVLPNLLPIAAGIAALFVLVVIFGLFIALWERIGGSLVVLIEKLAVSTTFKRTMSLFIHFKKFAELPFGLYANSKAFNSLQKIGALNSICLFFASIINQILAMSLAILFYSLVIVVPIAIIVALYSNK
ncbi:MAG: hypothetical protein EXR11_08380 [Rhodospirillaceae bacterium]|nr:hypothetical protein [Rhodospirillaceae bacterium]